MVPPRRQPWVDLVYALGEGTYPWGRSLQTFLGWIDGDPSHEDAVLKALGARGSQDAREELGLGSLRDSFADAFFPGLSTIQTRARYFFFVQWCCELAAHRSTEEDILVALHRHEIDLIRALSHLGPNHGVIGIDSQDQLKRMPSDIYWSGLQRLGLRQVEGSSHHWARAVIAAREAERRSPVREGYTATSSALGFDPDRPAMPERFPKTADMGFRLEIDERRSLRRRLGMPAWTRGDDCSTTTSWASFRSTVIISRSTWIYGIIP